MSVAAEMRLVKRRIDDYLWGETSAPLKSLRAFLGENILPFNGAAIVGGLVRDFARKGRRGFRSDVDIVIDAPTQHVCALAAKLGAVENRFGGFIHHGERWKIDFWALESTWASRAGHVAISSLEDVAKTTFFDCDAVIYNLKTRNVFGDEAYLSRLRARTIEINLLPNPSINGNLLRAVRRILYWDLQPGPVLSDFLLRNLEQNAFEQIKLIECKLYANPILVQFDSAEQLSRELISNVKRHRFDTSFAEQMEFPDI